MSLRGLGEALIALSVLIALSCFVLWVTAIWSSGPVVHRLVISGFMGLIPAGASCIAGVSLVER